ncbi:phage N-6-adenine-methyltransferase [Shimwellia blattae]|uniref:Putative DNA N-6-adenine-methyltransferase of bacteriophage n=1 Tax=Shimwellia blattae (strain ATCC 29907 / DSM 4481 / JCM 1650 / NBRC 105725 / CDC 9005-74) TaxID=630626 RepID=I2B9U7_SHIBC|nr:phage N-6-adenine-methyltransferase [Shimwellia blattae]AFJ47301.1 putative DNA N-6-adenine-methyltransferase of bacteriophage [Shimwellia blattae DSM 4481 = NBRC 105725]GAB80503.1 putative phage N-6-adenine-methyltransferase [Shimwellia blattae DSM 4481 = NBRC 105725]VDY64795.1 phage N-6-adenine-methyltransferase [Shimwellia blattae]VEC22894.1 phage N-6-adenine-methyltransferase [Shimwellia blattae]
MSDYGGSKTPVPERDLWQTPASIFTALDIEFGFYLDVAAAPHNALCARFMTEHEDALNSDWSSYGAIWCNPPYSDITPWIRKAAEQCQKQHQTVVMLLPADISTGWFSLALQTVDEIRLITNGRIQFVPASVSGKRQSNPKGSLLFIWRPFISPRGIFTTVSKPALEDAGQQYLDEVAA